jgi:hypothetical protein
MRAITVSEYGASPSVTELPRPQPGPGQVLIAVQAAGMNPMDMEIADGGWKDRMPATFPMVLGADLAGIVEGGGPGAIRFALGEAVFGQLPMTVALLDRLAAAVVAGTIVAPPITRVSLDEVPALLSKHGRAEGKTVITI